MSVGGGINWDSDSDSDSDDDNDDDDNDDGDDVLSIKPTFVNFVVVVVVVVVGSWLLLLSLSLCLVRVSLAMDDGVVIADIDDDAERVDDSNNASLALLLTTITVSLFSSLLGLLL